MTDKAYPTADLGIFRVHPCSRRFICDSPTILNTGVTTRYSWIGVEKARVLAPTPWLVGQFAGDVQFDRVRGGRCWFDFTRSG
ncbi:hypothetical protein [Nocardia asteroides]|uniref:hypothetical protein n=1 Tax=Nocardia asteroides TaxID=1824 RepID=UPI001E52865A|nr:hypothetical protein [Nocardia asteroides]UGT57002.1 hypothetical protein LTT85_09230 [Nocardia asteroides]